MDASHDLRTGPVELERSSTKPGVIWVGLKIVVTVVMGLQVRVSNLRTAALRVLGKESIVFNCHVKQF